MPIKDDLSNLIKNLKQTVKTGFTPDIISDAVQTLSELGYGYNHELFPILRNTKAFINNSTDSPANLAEALLWKLGKWNSYKKFAKQFSGEDSQATKTDVVFFAFAKHLKNPENNPIYDQHTLRSIWAICPDLTPDEKKKCQNLLFNRSGKWKTTGSGKHTVDCYQIFLKYINELEKSGASKREIDLLLMPLGQALKDSCKNYDEFKELCGW